MQPDGRVWGLGVATLWLTIVLFAHGSASAEPMYLPWIGRDDGVMFEFRSCKGMRVESRAAGQVGAVCCVGRPLKTARRCHSERSQESHTCAPNQLAGCFTSFSMTTGPFSAAC